MSYKYHEFFKS